MKNLVKVLVLGLMFSFGSSAHAAVIFTPVLETGPAGDDLECRVLNVSGKDIVADIQVIHAETGAVLAELVDATIAAERVRAIGPVDPGLGTVGYCKVSGAYRKRNVRVTLCVEPAGTEGCAGGVVTVP